MKLQKDLREFIELLNSTNAKYLLVGGHAVAFHGFPRYTGDIDFFIGCSPPNLERVAQVLRDFGVSSLAEELTRSASPGTLFQLGRPPNRIDLLTSIDAVPFEEAWQQREIVLLDQLQVFILSKSLLIRNKQASARPKDLEDIRQLQ